MTKKNRKKNKIDTSGDREPLRHNPFADLLRGQDSADLPEGPEPGSADYAPKSPDVEERLKVLKKVVLRQERKGRGGKTVTLVSGLDKLSERELDELASRMCKALGTGATLEKKTIVLQGDQRVRAHSWLADRGVKNVVAS